MRDEHDAVLVAAGLVSCAGAIAMCVVPALGWYGVVGTFAVMTLSCIIAYRWRGKP